MLPLGVCVAPWTADTETLGLTTALSVEPETELFTAANTTLANDIPDVEPTAKITNVSLYIIDISRETVREEIVILPLSNHSELAQQLEYFLIIMSFLNHPEFSILLEIFSMIKNI